MHAPLWPNRPHVLKQPSDMQVIKGTDTIYTSTPAQCVRQTHTQLSGHEFAHPSRAKADATYCMRTLPRALFLFDVAQALAPAPPPLPARRPCPVLDLCILRGVQQDVVLRRLRAVLCKALAPVIAHCISIDAAVAIKCPTRY